MNRVLRAGVIGAGVFGGYHAAKLSGFEDVRLTRVLDLDHERAGVLAERYGAAVAPDLGAFLDAVDVVSICSPAAAHAVPALAALQAGKACYVEKPLAVDPDEAQALVAVAQARGCVLAVGFLERVLLGALGLDAAPRPVLFEAVRRGLPSPRNRDVSVVLDLMIHDLDLALAIDRGEAWGVEADGVQGEAGLDEARAEITFDSGLIAIFEASRVAAAPERRLRLTWPSGVAEIDLLAGTLRNDSAVPLDAGFADDPAVKDRLEASLAAFLAGVRGERPAPLANGRDGLAALDLALAVEAAAA